MPSHGHQHVLRAVVGTNAPRRVGEKGCTRNAVSVCQRVGCICMHVINIRFARWVQKSSRSMPYGQTPSTRHRKGSVNNIGSAQIATKCANRGNAYRYFLHVRRVERPIVVLDKGKHQSSVQSCQQIRFGSVLIQGHVSAFHPNDCIRSQNI